MDLFAELVRLTHATGDSPLILGNVEFWIDPAGPWAGQLAFSIPTGKWDAQAIGISVSLLATIYPQVSQIVTRYAN